MVARFGPAKSLNGPIRASDHPLYKPKLFGPPAWTDWRVECPGDIGATFVKASDPETIEKIKAAFDDKSIEPHARAVSAIQSVPLKINPAMLPLVREFAGDEYRRDIIVAEALVDKPRFWNRVRCDRRGRLIQMCDFNYTRGDPVRSLFMFAEGKKDRQRHPLAGDRHCECLRHQRHVGGAS
jgi:hypothetical protein